MFCQGCGKQLSPLATMCPGCGAPTRSRNQAANHQIAKDPAIAVILELLPGMFLLTFGIGNIYAGNVGLGVGILLANWFLNIVNFFLVWVALGVCTWPVCWIGMAIFSTLMAHGAAKRSMGQA